MDKYNKEDRHASMSIYKIEDNLFNLISKNKKKEFPIEACLFAIFYLGLPIIYLNMPSPIKFQNIENNIIIVFYALVGIGLSLGLIMRNLKRIR